MFNELPVGSLQGFGSCAHPAALKPALDRLLAGQWKKGSIPPLWDGRTGGRIAEALDELLCG
jgi:UDP-N-acetylglucosamine 2-epimerase (non-hydrolysing)